VLDAVVGSATTAMERKVGEWTDKLNDVAEHGGAKQAAGAAGLRAELRGKNPAWAAVKGAWRGGSPAVRAAIVTAFVAMVPLFLISPVLLLVYLLSWLVIAAVMQVQASRKNES
jgi:hypothetical protein